MDPAKDIVSIMDSELNLVAIIKSAIYHLQNITVWSSGNLLRSGQLVLGCSAGFTRVETKHGEAAFSS